MVDPINYWCILLSLVSIINVVGGGGGDGADDEGGDGVEFDRTMLPAGYRFLPTDDELVHHYLLNKVCDKEILAPAVTDITADQFYSMSPKELAEACKQDMFFFIHRKNEQEQNCGKLRMVGDDKGIWNQRKEETNNLNENIFTLKKYFSYFSRMPSNLKKTRWVLEEYQLRCRHFLHNEAMCVLGRIRCVKDKQDYEGS